MYVPTVCMVHTYIHSVCMNKCMRCIYAVYYVGSSYGRTSICPSVYLSIVLTCTGGKDQSAEAHERLIVAVTSVNTTAKRTKEDCRSLGGGEKGRVSKAVKVHKVCGYLSIH